MKRSGHTGVNFFVGTEVEHSPAFGKRTIFVVGVQPVEQIAWAIGEADSKVRDPITHVYFGANQSFPNPKTDDAETWTKWETMLQHFLKAGYWTTLDIDSICVEGLSQGIVVDHPMFIPMISVKLPHLQLLGYNATIKLDDKDFAASNPGVWCHSLHDLKDRSKFTSWDQYTKDEVVK